MFEVGSIWMTGLVQVLELLEKCLNKNAEHSAGRQIYSVLYSKQIHYEQRLRRKHFRTNFYYSGQILTSFFKNKAIITTW